MRFQGKGIDCSLRGRNPLSAHFAFYACRKPLLTRQVGFTTVSRACLGTPKTGPEILHFPLKPVEAVITLDL